MRNYLEPNKSSLHLKVCYKGIMELSIFQLARSGAQHSATVIASFIFMASAQVV